MRHHPFEQFIFYGKTLKAQLFRQLNLSIPIAEKIGF